jgi:hypothetical protein
MPAEKPTTGTEGALERCSTFIGGGGPAPSYNSILAVTTPHRSRIIEHDQSLRPQASEVAGGRDYTALDKRCPAQPPWVTSAHPNRHHKADPHLAQPTAKAPALPASILTCTQPDVVEQWQMQAFHAVRRANPGLTGLQCFARFASCFRKTTENSPSQDGAAPVFFLTPSTLAKLFEQATGRMATSAPAPVHKQCEQTAGRGIHNPPVDVAPNLAATICVSRPHVRAQPGLLHSQHSVDPQCSSAELSSNSAMTASNGACERSACGTKVSPIPTVSPLWKVLAVQPANSRQPMGSTKRKQTTNDSQDRPLDTTEITPRKRLRAPAPTKHSAGRPSQIAMKLFLQYQLDNPGLQCQEYKEWFKGSFAKDIELRPRAPGDFENVAWIPVAEDFEECAFLAPQISSSRQESGEAFAVSRAPPWSPRRQSLCPEAVAAAKNLMALSTASGQSGPLYESLAPPCSSPVLGTKVEMDKLGCCASAKTYPWERGQVGNLQAELMEDVAAVKDFSHKCFMSATPPGATSMETGGQKSGILRQ